MCLVSCPCFRAEVGMLLFGGSQLTKLESESNLRSLRSLEAKFKSIDATSRALNKALKEDATEETQKQLVESERSQVRGETPSMYGDPPLPFPSLSPPQEKPCESIVLSRDYSWFEKDRA